MELVKFFIDNLMAPVFGEELDLASPGLGPSSVEADNDEQHESTKQNGKPKRTNRDDEDQLYCRLDLSKQDLGRQRFLHKHRSSDDVLDLDGPKLIHGARGWLIFYQAIGFINLPGRPLYQSLLFKLIVTLFANYILITHLTIPVIKMRVLDAHFVRNPLIILMFFVSLSVIGLNILVIFYNNLFNLGPLFKILSTPRLCFINLKTQDVAGSRIMKYMLILHVYYALIFKLLATKNFDQFAQNFSLLDFLLEIYALTMFTYNTIGLAHLDFYIRFSFCAWLLALRNNLAHRRARYERLRRSHLVARKWRNSTTPQAGQTSPQPGCHSKGSKIEQLDEEQLMNKFKQIYTFVALDEVQRNLNAMDDHLEVWRSVQSNSLVLISLCAFVANGAVIMISYNVFTKEHNTFVGLLWVQVALGYAVWVMLTYLGDSFVHYSLASFVQTVEDEYFQQDHGDDDLSGAQLEPHKRGTNSSDGKHLVKSINGWPLLPKNLQTSKEKLLVHIGGGKAPQRTGSQNVVGTHQHRRWPKCLLIRREEVLFCRELLSQFKNHLATPWSHLSVKGHLHIITTFATLIAAQIIFDTEH